MNERFEQFKIHLRKRKTEYLVAGGVIVGAVIGGTIVYFKLRSNDNVISPTINNCPSFDNVSDSVINVTNITNIMPASRTDPGNVWRDLSTGREWASTNSLVKEMGLPKTAFLNSEVGDTVRVGGHIFEMAGKAVFRTE